MGIDQAAAADALFACAKAGRLDPELASTFEEFRGETVESGLTLQLAVLDRWLSSGERLGGWKVGLTSRTARDSMGVDFRPFGYVLESRMFSSDDDVELGRISTCLIEPEIGVTIGASLGGHDVTPEQARAAVASISPAFEINERRLPTGLPMPIVLGNDLGQWGIVFGPPHDPDIDLRSLTLELSNDGLLVGSGGTGQDVIDDPYVSLARAARLLAANGRAFEPGQRVITGSLLAATPIDAPGKWSASYGELGEVSIDFV